MDINYPILTRLNKKYGDSFYLLDSNIFRTNYNELLKEFKSFYPNSIIGYSYKTNYTPFLCSIINDLGGYAEVVSEMEYDLAIKIGVEPARIIVNGPYKTRTNLIKYFTNGSLVNLDSQYEVDILKQISNEVNDCLFRVGVRCNFQISEKYVSRFGFDVESQEFRKIISDLEGIRNTVLEGIHCHFPDRILDLYETRVSRMLGIARDIFKRPPKFIDIGGGYFGKMPKYLAKQFNCIIPGYNDYAKIIAGPFNSFYADLPEEDKPKLIIEPGSAIVADCLKFITKVIDIKKIGERQIALTAGSKFNLGAFASTITMPMEVFYDSGSENHEFKSIDISGFTCIESDYLYKNYCGILGRNSYLIFSNIGSYSIVFKPPFILPNVPIIEINHGTNERIIKRKESAEDIFATFNFD